MRAPDRRMPIAVGHLDSLGDELDIDQSSSPELDVQPPGSLPPELLLHTPTELTHLLEVGRRRLGTVHEGANLPPHRAAEPRIAADEACTGQRLPLPRIGPFAVILPEGVEGRR